MVNEVPELPEWIQTLIQAAKDEAYQRGYDKGYAWGIEQAKKAIDNVGSRW